MLKKISPVNLEKFYKRKDEIERIEKEKYDDARGRWRQDNDLIYSNQILNSSNSYQIHALWGFGVLGLIDT